MKFIRLGVIGLVFFTSLPLNTIAQTNPPQEPKWGIVFGGDRSQSRAEFEVRRAKQVDPSYRDTFLFYRSRWYRSVILFKNKSTAEAALGKVNRQLRQGAYLINVNEWCSGWQSRSRKDFKTNTILYYQCQD